MGLGGGYASTIQASGLGGASPTTLPKGAQSLGPTYVPAAPVNKAPVPGGPAQYNQQVPGGPAPSLPNLGAILGQTASAQVAPPPQVTMPHTAPPPLQNSANTDPNMNFLINQLKGRIAGDNGTGRAIDVAGSKLKDYGQGLSSALDADAAARGVYGSGAAGNKQQLLQQDLQRQMAGQAADISLGRQRDLDQLLLGSGNIFEAPARLAQADKQLGLQQYLGQAGLDLQKYGIDKNSQMQQNAQNFAQQQQLMTALLGLYS